MVFFLCRNDRDSFVEIIEENIKHNKAHNFKKREKGDGKNQVAYTDTSYDFFSLLHYPQNAWSKDDKSETIRPINQLYQDIGRSGAMTATDKIDLNLHYECSDIDTYVLLEYVLEVEYRTSMERRKLKEEMKGGIFVKTKIMFCKIFETLLLLLFLKLSSNLLCTTTLGADI